MKNFYKFFFHGVFAGIIALVVFLGGVFAVANAADNNGGEFGEILNKILASGNWMTDTTGEVKNAQHLGGIAADKFQKTKWQIQSCPANQCITGFTEDGTIICR